MTPLTTFLIGFGKVADTVRHDARMARYFPDASHAQVLAHHEGYDFAAVVDAMEEARARAQDGRGVKTVAADVTATRVPRSENRGPENEWEIDSGAGTTAAVDARMCLGAMYDNLVAAIAGEPLQSSAAEALATEAVVHDIFAQAESTH